MSQPTGLIPPSPSPNNPFLSPAPSPSNKHQPLSYGPRAFSPSPSTPAAAAGISRQSSMDSMHSGDGFFRHANPPTGTANGNQTTTSGYASPHGHGHGAASPMMYASQPLLYSGNAGDAGSMSTLGFGGKSVGEKGGAAAAGYGYPSSPSSVQGGHDKVSFALHAGFERSVTFSQVQVE
ncbi:hypothetical protein QFC24_007006 [Naganishia onofrii]|uniref:Uncharacterized protein n=1 Tax=Naganishia onofrii TaxID=1851511 RepID=A0ACC2WUM0_9TREE|nr:hypothetical protein QFC24_007006 [Naganishia onofrii]